MTDNATPAASSEAPAAAADDKAAENQTTNNAPAEGSAPTGEAAPDAKADSLLPEHDAAPESKDDKPPEQKPDTTVNQDAPEWFLSDGVKGEGKPPEWFRADKYKTVDAQAKAYAELEKRFGAFTGAPKDGKYEFKLPDGVTGEFDTNHPLMQSFQEWATENQLSQKGYNDVLGMFAEYEASLTPDMNVIKSELGENADARITAVASWGKANLPKAQYDLLREATSGANAAKVFQVLESVIAQTAQARLPKPGANPGDAPPSGEAAIRAAQAKLGPDGKRLYETDPQYRARVEQMWLDYYNKAQAA